MKLLKMSNGKIKMKKIELLKTLLSKKLTSILLFSLGLTIFAIMIKSLTNKPLKASETEISLTPDTFIPEGYVLVPIAVSNYNSLNGLVHQFAIVNLYTTFKETRQNPKLVAASVKLIRSSVDANHFAVLVKQNDSFSIIKQNQEFFVTIQNPKHGDEIKVLRDQPNKIQYLD